MTEKIKTKWYANLPTGVPDDANIKQVYFDPEDVRVILDNRKTAFREIIKPQPVCFGSNITLKLHNNAFITHNDAFILSPVSYRLRCCTCGIDPTYCTKGSNVARFWTPPYLPGDILAVKETWSPLYPDKSSGKICGYMYKADTLADYDTNNPDGENYTWDGRWRSPVILPREGIRLFLRVTDVRVERLQSITYEGCKAEGIWDNYETANEESREAFNRKAYPIVFKDIWDKSFRPADRVLYGWDKNPWIYATEFERIKKPEVVG